MNRKRFAQLLVALGSLAGFLSVAVVDLGRTAPGAVARVHATIDEIDGGRSCNACHGGLFESMGEACLDCHEGIAADLADGVGLHGELAGATGMRCSGCHAEHNGAGFPLVNAQSFRLAGIEDRDAFDHAIVGYEMQGEHLELACLECHAFADHELVPEGEQRFRGLSQDCASCHDDPHEGAMRTACTSCHVQTSFDEHIFAQHEEVWPLAGSHADASCRDCHAQGAVFSLENHLAGRTPAPRECTACHENPHARDFVLGNALANRLDGDASCTLCHDPELHAFRGEGVTATAEQHAHAGFELDEPHTGLECLDCHAPERGAFAERFPGRAADDCAACHDDPHGGQFESDGFSNGRCVSCHATTHFEPHAFTADLHARAAMPLDGAHQPLDCGECHEVDGRREIRRFQGTPNRCEGCHSDAHEGYFGGFAAKLEHTSGGACAACHTTATFSEIPPPGFPHVEATGFPVRGAHAQSRCETCHERSAHPDEHGRTFGRIEEHFGAVKDCASCHDDPHAGAFDRPGLPAQLAGRRGCERCHDETSFRALPHGFDHARWTGFELDGAHAQASCSSCHAPVPPSRVAENGGRVRERARGNACEDCHADPHAGQFREDGRTDCASCHAPARSFRTLVFRHNTGARFALDETHAALDCSACHESVQVGEAEVVRYKPLGRECSSCHAMNEDVLRRPRRGNR